MKLYKNICYDDLPLTDKSKVLTAFINTYLPDAKSFTEIEENIKWYYILECEDNYIITSSRNRIEYINDKRISGITEKYILDYLEKDSCLLYQYSDDIFALDYPSDETATNLKGLVYNVLEGLKAENNSENENAINLLEQTYMLL